MIVIFTFIILNGKAQPTVNGEIIADTNNPPRIFRYDEGVVISSP